MAQTVQERALELVGSPSAKYNKDFPENGISQEGFDCSGFVTFVLQSLGIKIPEYIGLDGSQRPIRHVNEYWDYYGIAVHSGLDQPGDLIFFSSTGFFPSHMGIVIEGEKYIHAPGKNGTEVETKPISYEPIDNGGVPDRKLFSVNPIGFKAITVVADEPTYRYHQQIPR